MITNALSFFQRQAPLWGFYVVCDWQCEASSFAPPDSSCWTQHPPLPAAALSPSLLDEVSLAPNRLSALDPVEPFGFFRVRKIAGSKHFTADDNISLCMCSYIEQVYGEDKTVPKYKYDTCLIHDI